MNKTIQLNATLRPNLGTGPARASRRDKKLPAIIYGDKKPNLAVDLDYKGFFKEYSKGNLRSHVMELTLDGQKITVLAREIQKDKVSDVPIHVDLLRIGADTEVMVKVSIKLLNEDKSPGLKKGGVLNLVHRFIEFKTHPTEIPEHIDVDISKLDIGQSMHIQDIELPKGLVPVDKTNFAVLSIAGRSEEEASEAAAPTTPASK